MAITNHERVGKMLELLRDGLAPFVERELKTCWGEKWAQEVKRVLGDTRLTGMNSDPTTDVAGLLVIMDRTWKDVFSMTLGKAERSMVNDIEVGGQRGREALGRLRNAVGRVEASWRPASAEE
jgi:hypothetical protein